MQTAREAIYNANNKLLQSNNIYNEFSNWQFSINLISSSGE